MTEEQIIAIKTKTGSQLKVLIKIKHELHNNNWTSEFNNLVFETKSALISEIEELVLKPNTTLKPLTKSFSQEDGTNRQEINNIVSTLFSEFKNQNNV